MTDADDFAADAYTTPRSPVGPRMGLALWCAAREIVERAEVDPQSTAVGLPSCARSYGVQPPWLARLIDCFRAVRDRLGAGDFPIARCTGDEYATHIIIGYAAMADAAGVGPRPEEFGLQLIPGPDDDDYAAAHGDLLADGDVLMLFDPILDGIEDPTSDVNQRLGIGPWLHPRHWFDPFPGPGVADDESVVIAANDLAMRSGARAFTLQRNGEHWEARAAYRGRVLAGHGGDPHEAATDLVRRILEGGVCSHCGHPITIDPGHPDDEFCHWQRLAQRWRRGCEQESHA